MKFRIIISFLLLSFTAQAEVLSVIAPGEGTSEHNITLANSLLRLALEKSGQEYVFNPYTGGVMTQARLLKSLQDDDKIVTVSWAGTSKEREASLGNVRIPLYRGLIGNRVDFIKKEDQAKFSAIKTLEDFKNLNLGQPLGWASIDVFKNAGLT